MAIYRTYQINELKVGVWKVEETWKELLHAFQDTSLYSEGLARFSSDTRKQEWLAIRMLLKELCGEEKEIAYKPSGKPYLVDGSAYVSFSHTRGYVAVALHPASEVGIDIEQYGLRVQKVASRFIREDEKVSVGTGDEIYALLLHWSAKETIFKLMEENAVDFVDHLHILPFVPKECGVFQACEYRSDRRQRFLVHYDTHPDYVLTFSCLDSSLTLNSDFSSKG